MSWGAILFALGNLLLAFLPIRSLEGAIEQILLFQQAKRNQSIRLYRQYTRAIALQPAVQQVGWLERLMDINQPLQEHELQQIIQPTLLLWSARDFLFPPRIARTTATILPNAQLQIVPQTGHAAFLENPHQFATAILDFLKGNPTLQTPTHRMSEQMVAPSSVHAQCIVNCVQGGYQG